jgi:archaellum component FlaG (FlaF/FlaG flagellin family)
MILTIAGIAAAAAIFNAIFPVLNRSSGSIIQAGANIDDRLQSEIEIVHAVGELDANGVFSDTNGNGNFDTFIWVKNVGTIRILDITNTDVFIGQIGSFTRVPHEEAVEAGVYPRWTHSFEGNSTEWDPKATLKITVTYSATQNSGNYDVKVIIANGVSDEYFFSM